MTQVRVVATGEIIPEITRLRLWGPIVEIHTLARDLSGRALERDGCVVTNVTHYVIGDVEVLQ